MTYTPFVIAWSCLAVAVIALAIFRNLKSLQTLFLQGRDIGQRGQARRDEALLVVVEDVADLWALERATATNGRYHVLGGTLSALDHVGPDELRIPALIERITQDNVAEVILALNATVDGQTTAHYIADALAPLGIQITSLAQGVPIGGELNYLDDGTIGAALRAVIYVNFALSLMMNRLCAHN